MMKISVLIPAYNAAATIGPTLESVLAQTRPPDEIIVLDDGSTDQTAKAVEAYAPRVTLHRQKNRGLGSSRNVLCKMAQGDLVAFLDSDDLWHPRYLEVQSGLVERFPDAGAFFTGHTIFKNFECLEWSGDTSEPDFGQTQVMDSLSFFVTYNKAPGRFFMSFCCLPRRTISELG
ncbi:MAG: glycosyltransferase family A protein, partial [Terriglobales bacterium]